MLVRYLFSVVARCFNLKWKCGYSLKQLTQKVLNRTHVDSGA